MTTDLSANLLEGLYLMVVGMSFVLVFLTLVVIALKALAYFAPIENHSEPKTANTTSSKQVSDKRLLAVISAAIHQYQQDNRKS